MFLGIITAADAQQRVVRFEGGRKKVAESAAKADSLLLKQIIKIDTLLSTDSLGKIDTLITRDTTMVADTTSLAKAELAVAAKDSTGKKSKKEIPAIPKKRFSFTQDTIPAGRVTLLSLIPGVGQVYNRQYWKVPVTYALIGGFIAGGVISSNTYQKSKLEWERSVNLHLPQSQQDYARSKMENDGTTRTVLYSLAAATYLYQIADATFNYRGKVDHIRKATTLAAIFPGAGFIYTRTYWRLPIYYGGFIALATVIDYNSRNYNRYAKAYNSLTDKDPTTIDEFNGRYTPEMLQNVRNQYRRNRDFGIICMVGAYILSIVDTHVIATLKNWDISPDLSMTIEPTLIDNSMHRASSVPSGGGLALKIKF